MSNDEKTIIEILQFKNLTKKPKKIGVFNVFFRYQKSTLLVFLTFHVEYFYWVLYKSGNFFILWHLSHNYSGSDCFSFFALQDWKLILFHGFCWETVGKKERKYSIFETIFLCFFWDFNQAPKDSASCIIGRTRLIEQQIEQIFFIRLKYFSK